jgi:hypothetical protein
MCVPERFCLACFILLVLLLYPFLFLSRYPLWTLILFEPLPNTHPSLPFAYLIHHVTSHPSNPFIIEALPPPLTVQTTHFFHSFGNMGFLHFVCKPFLTCSLFHFSHFLSLLIDVIFHSFRLCVAHVHQMS